MLGTLRRRLSNKRRRADGELLWLRCPRCGAVWASTRLTIEAPFIHDVGGCPTCGPRSGFDVVG